MKVYLASPWFNKRQEEIYEKVITKMRSQGINVFVPREHSIQNAWGVSNASWGHKVFMTDINAIDECDEMWVLNFGMDSDTGTAWENGYAYAKGKTIRMLLDTEATNIFSLMSLNGCDEYDSISNYLNDTNETIAIEMK